MSEFIYTLALFINVVGGSVLVVHYWTQKPRFVSAEFGLCLVFICLIVFSLLDNVFGRTLLGPALVCFLITKDWYLIRRELTFENSFMRRAANRSKHK